MLVLACVLFLMSISTAYAYTSGIGTLEVDDWGRTYAYAATSSSVSGYITVSLSVTIYNQDTNTSYSTGDGGGSTSGYVYTSVSAESPQIITNANSYHTDPDGHRYISWNPLYGYSG